MDLIFYGIVILLQLYVIVTTIMKMIKKSTTVLEYFVFGVPVLVLATLFFVATIDGLATLIN